MTFEPGQTLTILLHSMAKIGKTTLALTAPGPILILDVDGKGTKFLKARKKEWDPYTQNAPVADGTWDICVVYVRQWNTIPLVYKHLTGRPHGFVSVVLDSITELQSTCKKNLKGTDAMRTQDWGALLDTMDEVLHQYRDMTDLKDNSLRCVVLIAETKVGDGKGPKVPRMQGQVAERLPFWVDATGYLFVTTTPDVNGQLTVRHRSLGLLPTPEYEAGSRFEQVLPAVITDQPGPDNPLSITSIMTTMYKETTV